MNKFIKKAATALILSLSLTKASYAQENSFVISLLSSINKTTYSILDRINQTPGYIQTIVEMALSWIDTTDNNNVIPINGALFNLLSESRYKDYLASVKATKDFSTQNFNGLIDINAFSYTTTLGEPPSATLPIGPLSLPTSTFNYFTNLSGANSMLKKPIASWKTGNQSQLNYYNLYSNFAAIESFNTFVLSKIYAERSPQLKYPSGIPNRSPNTPASTQDILAATIENTSSPSWYAQVSSESLGLVLRQILIYNSQLFILLKNILDTEQQMLMSQVMTNTILMEATTLGYGQILYQQANR